MIDWIKIKPPDSLIPSIRNNPRLEWTQTASEETGDIQENSAVYYGITFTIKYGQFLHISGSLHKHWNLLNGRGEQNYNDFDSVALVTTLRQFCTDFDLNPFDCIIENIEFGVNVTPVIPVSEILKAVINHKGKHFNRTRNNKMNYLECEHSQYYVKFYHKGLQYDQGNILRFEIKTRKMEYIRTAKINTLAGLLNPVNYSYLGLILNKNFSEIQFYDPTIPDTGINARDRLVLTQGQIPAFWETYKKAHPDNYYKKRNRFRDILKKYGTLDLSEILGKLVSDKWDELTRADLKTLQELTGGRGPWKKPDFTGIDTSIIESKSVHSLPEENAQDQKGVNQRRYCLTCGRDISGQNKGSKFCSAKIVGYSQAHKCRNTDSNPRNRIKYLMAREKESLTLFSTIPYMSNAKRIKTA